MLLIKPEQLKKYSTNQRHWQGIPSVEVTKKGRIFVTFYSGGVKEEIGNYSFVVMSDDGVHYTEPIAVAMAEEKRCFDPCLWIDPLGRLWFTWSQCPDDGLYGAICEDPDADELVWTEEFFIGHNIMMNKPTVLSTGEWLFPIAVWRDGVRGIAPEYDYKIGPRKSLVYSTVDQGKTFQMIGGSDVDHRSFDEHQILEMQDKSLNMYVRTYYGIALSKSYDRGVNWTKGCNSGLKNPSSRFHIKRLDSGRILLINHVDFQGRNNLAALLSEDDGKTWPYKLLLDERNDVSYPDVAEGPDGSIYVVYDRERGAFKSCLAEVNASAREILMAKITEQDIIDGCVNSETGYLKRVVNKIGTYEGMDVNPFHETALFTDRELAEDILAEHSGEEAMKELFDRCYPQCLSMEYEKSRKLDELIGEFLIAREGHEKFLTEMISVIRTVDINQENEPAAYVGRIIDGIDKKLSEEMTLNELSVYLQNSLFFMCYAFEKETATTIQNFRLQRRMVKVKELLLHSDMQIDEIGSSCGFADSTYFVEVFANTVGMPPFEYRFIHAK